MTRNQQTKTTVRTTPIPDTMWTGQNEERKAAKAAAQAAADAHLQEHL